MDEPKDPTSTGSSTTRHCLYYNEDPFAQLKAGMPAENENESPTAEDLTRLGRLIRERRSGTYSVEALAKRARVSAGLISQIERGRANPSFNTLSKLAGALGLRIGDLLLDPNDDLGSARMVVRKNERKRLQAGQSGLVYELLTPDLQRSLEVLRTRVPPGFRNESRPFQHAGEECVHLMTGTLEVTVGDDHFRLEEGDSITYDPSRPHWWHNSAEDAAVIIGAVTPPSF